MKNEEKLVFASNELSVFVLFYGMMACTFILIIVFVKGLVGTFLGLLGMLVSFYFIWKGVNKKMNVYEKLLKKRSFL